MASREAWLRLRKGLGVRKLNRRRTRHEVMLPQRLFAAFVFAGLLGGGCVRDLDLGESDPATDTAPSPDLGPNLGTTGTVEATETDPEADTDTDTDTRPPIENPIPDVIDDLEAWSLDYAQRRCAALRACDCTMPYDYWNDGDTCEFEIEQSMLSRFEWAGIYGLVLVPECLDGHLDLLAQECDATSPPLSRLDVADAQACRLFVGSDGVGAPCPVSWSTFWSGTSCAPGLVCTDGGCREYPEVGEPCLPDFASVSYHHSALGRGRCGPEAACLDGTCEPIRQLGESCELRQCAENLYCDEGSCVDRVTAGTACARGYECASGRCEGQMCSAPLAALCGLSPEEYPSVFE